MVAHGDRGPADVGEFGELTGAQHRHRGDGDPAGLQGAEPRGDEPGVVGAAQQDAVAGPEAEVLGEDLGDLVGTVLQFAVGPALGRGEQAGTVGAVLRDGFVEQASGAVEAVRVVQLR